MTVHFVIGWLWNSTVVNEENNAYLERGQTVGPYCDGCSWPHVGHTYPVVCICLYAEHVLKPEDGCLEVNQHSVHLQWWCQGLVEVYRRFRGTYCLHYLHTRRRKNLKSHLVYNYGKATLRYVRRFEALRIKKANLLWISETSVNF
jgi:hypothetical protein